MAQHYFVVLDPTSENQPALERACQLASATGASLHAFSCTFLDEKQMGEYHSRHDAKHAELERLRVWTEQQIKPARDSGLTIVFETYWNADWYQAAIIAAANCDANLIVKSTFPHSHSQRLLHRTSDYTLLRHASCPVLLAHSGNQGRYSRLLAALDLSGDDAHSSLNDSILEAAHTLSRECQAELHVVSALDQGPIAPVEPGWIPPEQFTPDLPQLAIKLGVDENKIHVRHGGPKRVIEETVEALGSDLLVIGTIARKGLSAALMGNTAEQTLDSVACDLLVVNRT